MTRNPRIGIMVSGTGSNMMEIVKKCRTGEIEAEIAFVGSDNPESKGLAWAKKEGLPTISVNFKQSKKMLIEPINFNLILYNIINEYGGIVEKMREQNFFKKFEGGLREYFRWKIRTEQMLLEEMANYDFDLLVLAGYMQVCTPHFIESINTMIGQWRIMNIHPALLPAFPGTDGYGDAWRYGVKVHGCTVHFIDTGIDTGPIIDQACYQVSEEENFESFKKRGLAEEYILYPRCIRLFTENRLKVKKNESGRQVVEIL